MKEQMINSKKAVMIGCGFVGSASVFALMQIQMQIKTRRRGKRWISVTEFHSPVR